MSTAREIAELGREGVGEAAGCRWVDDELGVL
jgi:hypothetical protein